MESWRITFRVLLTIWNLKELAALRAALESDDPRLVQGSTTEPPPIAPFSDAPPFGGCLLCFPAVALGHVATVDEAVDHFFGMCKLLEERLGCPGWQHLTEWFDTTDRDTVRRELLAEVLLALSARKPDPTTPPAAVAVAA